MNVTLLCSKNSLGMNKVYLSIYLSLRGINRTGTRNQSTNVKCDKQPQIGAHYFFFIIIDCVLLYEYFSSSLYT